MTSFIRILSLALFAAVAAIPAFADDSTAPLDITQVRAMLTRQGLEKDAVEELIKQMNGEKKEPLMLSTVLFTHGGNGAFFVDNDNWNVSAAINYKGKTLQVKNLFDMYYYDGGFKIELVYKWVWVFIPEGTSIDSLDGARFGGPVFGRGIALETSFIGGMPASVEAGWVEREDAPGNAYIISVKAGFVGSSGARFGAVKNGKTSKLHIAFPTLSFPRLEFKQKKVLELR